MGNILRHRGLADHEVFDVLSDGWTYSNWVVGTSHIRAVDYPCARGRLPAAPRGRRLAFAYDRCRGPETAPRDDVPALPAGAWNRW